MSSSLSSSENYNNNDDYLDNDDDGTIKTSSATTTSTATMTTAAAAAAVPSALSLRYKLGLLESSSSSTATGDNSNDDAATTTTTTNTRPPPPSIPQQSSSSTTTIKVVGHRGAMYEYLENTVDGFVQCAKWGCHAIELDVFVVNLVSSSSSSTSNGRANEEPQQQPLVVVFHGNDNSNHPNGRPGGLSGYILQGSDDVEEEEDTEKAEDNYGGDDNNNNNDNNNTPKQQRHNPTNNICDLSSIDEIQQLRFNPNFAEFVCPTEQIERGRIPTLQDVLMALQPYPQMEIKIELKGPTTNSQDDVGGADDRINRRVVQTVVDLVEQYGASDKCSYSSFDLDLLRELHDYRGNNTIRGIGALFTSPTPHDYIQQAIECGATEIHLRYDECTVQRIIDIHTAGLGSMAWFRGPVGMKHDLQYNYLDVQNNDSNGSDDVCTEGTSIYQTLMDTGVQQICCNKPNLLLQLLLLLERAKKASDYNN